MKTELKTNKKQIKTTAFALTCVWSLSYIFILSVKDIDFFYDNSLSASYSIIIANILLTFTVAFFVKKNKIATKGIYKTYFLYSLIAFAIILITVLSLNLLIAKDTPEISLFLEDNPILPSFFHMTSPLGIVFNWPNYPSAIDLLTLVFISYYIPCKLLKIKTNL